MGSMRADRMPLALLLLLLLFAATATALDIRSCNSALGMESGAIADSALNASSSYVTNVGPRYARLRKETAGGGWCPKRQIENGVREWIQIDLGGTHMVTAIETQGRFDHGRGQEYTEEYTVEYWRPGFTDWRPYKLWNGKEVLAGNVDTSTIVTRELVPAIFAQQLRVLPHSVHRRTVCLRLELKGCPDHSGIVSYTIPESPVEELNDTWYDGVRDESGYLSGGLGRLMDGEVGADNYKQDIGLEKGTGWVAWMRDSFPDNYVEMSFLFETLRCFNTVHIYTNNYFKRDVQVFARAEVWFVGDEEQIDEDEAVTYSYIPDTNLENARNVSIALHGRQGKFLKFRLHFAARWIIISEVTFDSWDPNANASEESSSEISNEESSGNGSGANSSTTVNHEADLNLQTITAREEDQEYVEVLIGVLTAITLLLLLVFIIILLLSRRQKLQSSPTVLKNPFGFAISMKGFLLNLTPGRVLNNSGRGSPDEEDEDEADAMRDEEDLDVDVEGLEAGVAEGISIQGSLTMEQFSSSLVESQYRSTYAIVSNTDTPNRDLQRMDELRSSKSFEKGYCSGSLRQESSSRSCSPVLSSHYSPSTRRSSQHYRTLQGKSSPSAAVQQRLSTSTHQQQREPEYGRIKRWHTAPKEKHKVPAPIARWNIAPSMSKPYKCKEIEPVDIPGQCLHTMEKLGAGHIGEVIICAVLGLKDSTTSKFNALISSEPLRLAVARIPNTDFTDGSPSDEDTLREIRYLSCLSDPNLARILGIVYDATEPSRPWTIIEYTELGDLAHYLQYSEPLVGTQRPNCSLNFISQNCLLYMGMQVVSAMRYLESKHLVHKDLAARNCLLGRAYTVKVTDIAMCSDLYKKDYSDIGGKRPVPIRWLPWESMLLDRYTNSSTVWSYAVTLWEIMSFAREKPFQHLTNEQVIHNAELMYYGGELQVLLPKPMMCPEEVYSVMCSCWKRDESIRPSFKEIYAFLKSITADYRPRA
ncbi:discoidin domain-containing receptor 2-like [Phymastichus coffea]|uniref:discoidin domain-containing receptor 2-like n=1 Tax=Phymastichus coffea TaxID=108790 RepID=UPI00273B4896|nr:discoidin domain-containing receptor 2-like [Phymastichus coffea]